MTPNDPTLSIHATFISALMLSACTTSVPQASRAEAFFASVANLEGCSVPNSGIRDHFVKNGFVDPRERLELFYQLKTQAGAFTVTDEALLANSQSCGRPPVILATSRADFDRAFAAIVDKGCRVPVSKLRATYEPMGIGPNQLRSYLQIIVGSGIGEVNADGVTLNDWECEVA